MTASKKRAVRRPRKAGDSQETRKGYEIPIPIGRDFIGDLSKASKKKAS